MFFSVDVNEAHDASDIVRNTLDIWRDRPDNYSTGRENVRLSDHRLRLTRNIVSVGCDYCYHRTFLVKQNYMATIYSSDDYNNWDSSGYCDNLYFI
jgi:hypothetical protein